MIAIAAMVLTSCGIETSMCPSYGGRNKITKFGTKAQARYSKHNKKGHI